MRCDLVVDRTPLRWVDDTPFLLWEIGMKTVLEHWVDALYESNHRAVLWLEEVDSRLLTYANETFPLCRNTAIRIGVPATAGASCTFLNAEGEIVIRPGSALTTYLPAGQVAATTWFRLVKRWLDGLQQRGSVTPELEQEVQPGVFVGHHCRIAKGTIFQAPCWIGHGSTIAAAEVGPYAVVGENCIVAGGTRVAESYVLRDTFVGEDLTLSDCVVQGEKLLHHPTAVLAAVPDGTLLHSVAA